MSPRFENDASVVTAPVVVLSRATRVELST